MQLRILNGNNARLRSLLGDLASYIEVKKGDAILTCDTEEKVMVGRLCAGPTESVPVYDSMLSQKLWLENDEEGFLRVANKEGGWEEIQPFFVSYNIGAERLPLSASAISYEYRGLR